MGKLCGECGCGFFLSAFCLPQQLFSILFQGVYTMKDQVLAAMVKAGKPVRPGDIAKELDVDSKEVSKAIDALKKEGKIHSPKRCFYAPV